MPQNYLKLLPYCGGTGLSAEEDGHAHVSVYFCIETITKVSVKFKQVPFKSVPQV